MKFIFYFILLANVTRAQTWAQLTDFPSTERDDGVAAVINNIAYAGTGLANGIGVTNDFYRLDLSTQTWSAIASMPNGTNRQYASAFTYSNYLFVTGGLTSGNIPLSDTYRYDVMANSWVSVASKPGAAAWGACSFTLNNKAYIAGGKFSNGTVSDEVWEYDMSVNTWTQKNNITTGGRWRGSAAVINNTPYMIFGFDNNGSFRKELYKYTASNDSWSKVADFPQPNKGRIYAAMQGLLNKLVIFGGHDTTNTFFNDAWFFDEVNGFVQGPSMPALPRKGGMSFANGNKFYYTCGVNNAPVRIKETWLLDVPVGIKEYNNDLVFSVYPDPCTDELAVLSDGNHIFSVELCDSKGLLLFEKRMSETKETIHLSGLANGLYFLKIKSSEGVSVKKIIKN